MLADISSQTTNVTDSTADRTINTCLADLNVFLVTGLPYQGQENAASLEISEVGRRLYFRSGSDVAEVRHLPVWISMEANREGKACVRIAHRRLPVT